MVNKQSIKDNKVAKESVINIINFLSMVNYNNCNELATNCRPDIDTLFSDDCSGQWSTFTRLFGEYFRKNRYENCNNDVCKKTLIFLYKSLVQYYSEEEYKLWDAKQPTNHFMFKMYVNLIFDFIHSLVKHGNFGDENYIKFITTDRELLEYFYNYPISRLTFYHIPIYRFFINKDYDKVDYFLSICKNNKARSQKFFDEIVEDIIFFLNCNTEKAGINLMQKWASQTTNCDKNMQLINTKEREKPRTERVVNAQKQVGCPKCGKILSFISTQGGSVMYCNDCDYESEEYKKYRQEAKLENEKHNLLLENGRIEFYNTIGADVLDKLNKHKIKGQISEQQYEYYKEWYIYQFIRYAYSPNYIERYPHIKEIVVNHSELLFYFNILEPLSPLAYRYVFIYDATSEKYIVDKLRGLCQTMKTGAVDLGGFTFNIAVIKKRFMEKNEGIEFDNMVTDTCIEFKKNAINYDAFAILHTENIDYDNFYGYSNPQFRLYSSYEIGKDNIKRGYREDLRQGFRSAWEANFARILNYKKIEWEFEKTFFPINEDKAVKYASTTYIPDFFLMDGTLIEVKGMVDNRSLQNIKLFKEQYLEENLIIIDADIYYILNRKYSSLIEFWEKESKSVPINNLFIVGITFNERRKFVDLLGIGDEVFLKRELGNKYDSNAIQVLDANNNILGYVASDMACYFAPKIDIGIVYKLIIKTKEDNVIKCVAKAINLDTVELISSFNFLN